MYVTLVHVHVKPENVRDFIEATLENCQAAVHEHGNLRFDLLELAEDPCRFILYEAYETAEDAAGMDRLLQRCIVTHHYSGR